MITERVSPPSVCPVCFKGTDFRFVENWAETQPTKKSVKWTLYECSNCGVQFWFPFRQAERTFYDPEESFEATERKKDLVISFLLNSASITPWNHRLFYIDKLKKDGRLLDVGCADGKFLRKCRKLGYKVYGLEINRHKAEALRQDGIECFPDYLDRFVSSWRDRKEDLFDCVTAFEVLEHVTNPLDFLKDINTLLKSGGIFVASVPFRGRAKFFEDGDHPPNHFTRWDERSLTKILEKAGFKVSGVHKRPLSVYTVAGNIFCAPELNFFSGQPWKIAKFFVAGIAALFLWLPMRLGGGRGRSLYVIAHK